jgi:hypothetical protein
MIDQDGVARSFLIEDDVLYSVEQQEVQDLLDENRALATLGEGRTFGHARWRKLGSIPIVIAEQWARECGARIGTPEFAAYVRRKLLDPDFAGFRVHPQ